MGVIIGYHRESISRLLTPARRVAIVVAGSVLAIVLILAFQLTIADRASEQPSALAWLLSSDLVFGKNDLRPGRLLALVGVAIFAFALVSMLWVPIRRGLGWLLLPLGQRSLGAYGIHLFILVLTNISISDFLRIGNDNTLLQVASIVLIWALLPVIPWLGEIEHLASRVAPLTHPFTRRASLRARAAQTG
ncbi:MAG: hypothetical protein E6J13_10515 [Chloroflexi bacterium]|nr:MAG: hypothetical protein E6J13_10515 [Chloroflexota bacterium]